MSWEDQGRQDHGQFGNGTSGNVKQRAITEGAEFTMSYHNIGHVGDDEGGDYEADRIAKAEYLRLDDEALEHEV